MSKNFLILLLITILFGSCKKNEVKLTFELSGGINSPCRIIYYASDKKKGMIRETMVEIRGGKGEIILPERNPALFFLMEPSATSPAAIFYAKRGEQITVTGNGENITEWKISGNKISEELSTWRVKNADVLKKGDILQINKVVKEYVEKHTDSKAALILLYFYFSRHDNEMEFYSLQSKFDKKIFEDEEFMNALAAPDIMAGLADLPRIPSQIVLRGDTVKTDTVKLSGGNGTLLIFKGNSSEGDEIKPSALASLAQKAVGKTIAEIWADTDSMAWRRYIGRDTIKNVKRMLMPLGVVDNTALSLGVRRLPYFIVVDPKGKELYRGSSSSEAIRQFESIK